MLFYIDRTVSEELGERELSDQEHLFFVDLASACQRGKCFISGDINSLSVLADRMGSRIGNVYLYAKGKRADHGSIMRAVKTVFVLTFATAPTTDSLPAVLQGEGKCCFLSIPESISNGLQLNGSCCLLTENLTDAVFYKIMAKRYCALAEIRGLSLSFHCEPGGGNTICDSFRKCVVEEKTPTLCIVDSDRKHGVTDEFPNEPKKGETLNRVAKVEKAFRDDRRLPPYCLCPLHVHEAENLIPIQTLRDLALEYPMMNPGLCMLERLKTIDGGKPLLYYDLKSGFPYMKSKPQRAYWQAIMLQIGGTQRDMPPETKAEGDAQTTFFFPPVNNNELLKHSIEELNENKPEEIAVDAHLMPLWAEIGAVLLTWGCASNPLSA